MMNQKIGFDITGKERGRIFENYMTVKNELEKLGFFCEEYDNYQLNEVDIDKYEILIFPCPDNSKFNSNELDILRNYVNNGNNLILLSHAGGDKGRRTNLSVLSQIFGIKFNNDQVFDKSQNLDLDSFPLVSTHSEYYSNKKIGPVCYRIGCSLEILNNKVLPLAVTNSTAIPDNAVIAAFSEYGKGRVVCVGSYEMFRDDVKGGITYNANLEFFLFLIEILIKIDLKNDKINDFLPDDKEIYSNKNDTQEFMNLQKSSTQNITNEHQLMFKEFQKQVYELLKQQQLSVDQLNNKFEIINKKLEQIKNKQVRLEEEYNNIKDKVLTPNIEIYSKELPLIDYSMDFDLIKDGLAEFRLESNLINKKIDELEMEQKKIKDLLKNPQKIQQNNINDSLLNSNENIIFVKASDLVRNNRPPHFNNNFSNKIELSQNTPNLPLEFQDRAVAPNPINNKTLQQFQKFLHFLKHQFEIGIINEKEYLNKKAKIECKIRETM